MRGKQRPPFPGYKFYSNSSLSAAGGVGLNVKSDVIASKRNDLTFRNNDFETIWVGIDNHFDVNKFVADYTESKSSIVDVNSDINKKFVTFLLNLSGLVNKHCPQKRLSKNRLKQKRAMDQPAYFKDDKDQGKII